MGYSRFQRLLGCLTLVMLAAPLPSYAKVDCEELQKLSQKESFKASQPEVRECMFRGWPVPGKWVPDEGKGAGLNSSGAKGFSYGSKKAPESPPGSRQENASVTKDALMLSCSFPPRIKLGFPPSISFGAGSCLDFLNDLFKDKNGNSNSTTVIVGIDPADAACPAKSNNAQIYGEKKPASGSVVAPCGAMVPTTTTDMTLVRNPTNLAVTTNGSYYIWTYRKSGGGFAAGATAVKLPSYLCGTTDAYGLPVKTTDLTPPLAQMITYKASDGYIAIRLQSRSTAPPNYLPPYNAADPEKYLVLPLNAAGDPVVPGDCSAESYYRTVPTSQEIQIHSATASGIEGLSMPPTMFNEPICPGGGAPDCGVDENGDPIMPVSNWVARCQSGGAPSGGKCPEEAAIPPVLDVSPGATAAEQNCDVVTMPVPAPSGGACADKLQYSVLDQPSLYYPSGTTAKFQPIAGLTATMAETVNGNRLYTQGQTVITVQATAPALTFEEGGYILQKNGDKLIMDAPAMITPGSGAVTLKGGGQLVSDNGSQLNKFAAGTVYTVPGGAPYEVHVGRSITLPSGYLIPTPPSDGANPPYAQLPVDETK